MNDFTSIEKFGGFEEAAIFLLHESFNYAYQAAEYEVAAILFGERIKDITPKTLSSRIEEQGVNFYPTIAEYMTQRDDIDKAISQDEDVSKLAKLWNDSQRDAFACGVKLSQKHKINAIDMIGHIINLSTCLEACINRHLFLERELENIQAEHFKYIDSTGLMAKVLFSFKDEIISSKLKISRMRKLISLRNKAVHFNLDSRSKIAPSVEELQGIWTEFGQIMNLIEGDPSQAQVIAYADEMADKWFE
jgi:hypothetical protein